MNIVSRYLWKNALGGILMASFALVMLDSFFALVSELQDVNDETGYSTADAILYIIYTLPQRLYEYFPTSILVGALLGLGRLSSNSEFTAMRAAGVSIMQIALATIQLGVFLALITFALGEWVIPATDRHASNFKAVQKNKKVAITSDRGLWVKEKQEIIQIGKLISNNELADITIYRVSDEYEFLKDLTTIENAYFDGKQWTLENVVTRKFTDDGFKIDRVEQAQTTVLVNPEILDVTVAVPDQLSSTQLSQIIQHQEKNGLSSDKFKLAFWKHFSVPLSAVVMLMLAMPFLFAGQRSAGSGQRLFIGITVGIVFFLINRVLNEIGIVYSLPPMLSAFFPLVIFMLISLIGLARINFAR